MNYCNFFVISWLPKYLVEVVGLSLEESGVFLLLPYIAPFGGVLLAGQVSDALIRRGWKVVHVRKTLQTVSDVGQAVRAATVGLVCCDCCRDPDAAGRCCEQVCIGYFVVEARPSAAAFTVIMGVAGFCRSLHIAGCAPPSPCISFAAPLSLAC